MQAAVRASSLTLFSIQFTAHWPNPLHSLPLKRGLSISKNKNKCLKVEKVMQVTVSD